VAEYEENGPGYSFETGTLLWIRPAGLFRSATLNIHVYPTRPGVGGRSYLYVL